VRRRNGGRSQRFAWLLAASAALWLAACGDDESTTSSGGPPPLFPANYAASYTEVRDCRNSGDHDLNVIRVLADPAALDAYQNRDAPLPVGAILLKEEYEFGDESCSGPLVQWTVMQRLEAGSSPDALDWHWQRVDAERNVVGVDTPKCYGCHSGCTPEAGGYENTCTVP
jgi:hypothetical protein